MLLPWSRVLWLCHPMWKKGLWRFDCAKRREMGRGYCFIQGEQPDQTTLVLHVRTPFPPRGQGELQNSRNDVTSLALKMGKRGTASPGVGLASWSWKRRGNRLPTSASQRKCSPALTLILASETHIGLLIFSELEDNKFAVFSPQACAHLL